jgi:hypothetical protein
MLETEGKKLTVNCETGEITYDVYSAEEIAEQLAKGEEIKALKESVKQAALSKAALLDRLGITADEAKLLLG